MKKIITIIILCLVCLLISATCFAAETYIEATGRGYPAEFAMAEDYEYQRITAFEAAKLDAYAGLAERLNGIQIDATSKVVNLRLANKTVESKLSAVIRGAEVIHEEYDGRVCKVVLRVPLYGGAGSVADAVIPSDYKPEAFTKPAFSRQGPVKPQIFGGYTGAVIDCRGLDMVTAMSPVILSDTGNKLYGYKNLNRGYIIRNGMAGYYNEDTIDKIAYRAGSNPLRIKAVAVEQRVNPVISAADANRLLWENSQTHFLEQCAVVFLKD